MKLGLSLCGGGSKGSYELGVWEALKELNIDFDIVTGSSIGALNGCMIIQDEYDKCVNLWNNVNINHILENICDIEEYNLKNIKPFLKQYVNKNNNYIQPFKNLLYNYLNCEKIRRSNKIFGVVVTSFPFMKKEEVILNEENNYNMYNYLLATSSLFPIFPTCKFNNKQYIDGGFSDNLPIELAFKLGASRVIAVDLNYKITHKKYLNNPYVDYIYPKWDLGSVLYFNNKVLNKNRLLGYYDTLKYYHKYDGFKYTFKTINHCDNLLTTTILSDVSFMKNNNLSYYYKKERNKDILSYLNKDIYGKILDKYYLIKCIEELGVIYSLNPCVIYDYNSYINITKSEINKTYNSLISKELSSLNTENKRKEYIYNCNKKEFINFLYYNQLDNYFKIFLLQYMPQYYLCYILFQTVGEYNDLQIPS